MQPHTQTLTIWRSHTQTDIYLGHDRDLGHDIDLEFDLDPD